MTARKRERPAEIHVGRTFTVDIEGAGQFVMRPMSARQFIRSLRGEWTEEEVILTLSERCISHPFEGEFLDAVDIVLAQALAAEWVRLHREAPIPPATGGS